MNCSERCGMKSFVLVVILIVIEKIKIKFLPISKNYVGK